MNMYSIFSISLTLLYEETAIGGVLIIKVFIKFHRINRNALVSESIILNKATGLRPTILSKKRL